MEKGKNCLDIERTFNQCFKSHENSNANIAKFNETLLKLHYLEVSPKSLSQQIMGLMKKHKNDEKVLECLESALEGLVTNFFEKIPGTVDAFFFPSEDNEHKLVKYLSSAKTSLICCVFTITNNHLANALYCLHAKGVNLRIISDDECANALGSDVNDLASSGIPTRTDQSKKNHMHNKFAVIDNKVLITGSFNWTSQAVNANQENIAVIENSHLVKLYNQEFEKLWSEFSKNTVKGTGETPYRFKKLKIY